TLEPGDLLAERRLRNAQTLSSPREVQLLGHHRERLHPADVDWQRPRLGHTRTIGTVLTAGMRCPAGTVHVVDGCMLSWPPAGEATPGRTSSVTEAPTVPSPARLG